MLLVTALAIAMMEAANHVGGKALNVAAISIFVLCTWVLIPIRSKNKRLSFDMSTTTLIN
jgi:hypothetical protein